MINMLHWDSLYDCLGKKTGSCEERLKSNMPWLRRAGPAVSTWWTITRNYSEKGGIDTKDLETQEMQDLSI